MEEEIHRVIAYHRDAFVSHSYVLIMYNINNNRNNNHHMIGVEV